MKANREEARRWLTQWPVGSRGLYKAGRTEHHVTVEAHEQSSSGWPLLVLRTDLPASYRYYCPYGIRRVLQRLAPEAGG